MKVDSSGLKTAITLLLLASLSGVDGFWRILCHGTLGTARIDPVVNFGEISPHAHNIAGASSKFGPKCNMQHVRANRYQTLASSPMRVT